jgi:hypothetical protein
MTIYNPDGLFAFGNAETVELPINTGAPDTANDASAKAPLGTLYRFKGNLYRYVKFDNGTNNVAAIAYGVAHWKTLTPASGIFTVTSDYADALASINGVAGILGCVVTDAYYTWIQVGGVATVKCAASMVAGDKGIGDSGTNLQLARIAAGSSTTSIAFGIATASRDGDGFDTFILEASRLACL